MRVALVQSGLRAARLAGWNTSTAVLLVVLTMLSWGCHPPDPSEGGGTCVTCPPVPPPPAAGTLRAVINDTLCAGVAASPPASRYASKGDHSTLVIDGLLFNPGGQLVGILNLELHGSIGPGSYPLTSLVVDPGVSTSGSVGFLVQTSRATLWSTDDSHVGTLTITKLDTAGLRVEGTFSFDGINPVTGTLKTVREGVFSSSLEVVN